MNTCILTDTSCGISKEEAKNLGYEMLPLPFLLDEVEYDEDKISKEEFYIKLKESKDIHTSQTPINVITDAFDSLLTKYDNILYLPITSGLSSTYQNILPIIEDSAEYKDRVVAVDHKTISVLQRGLLEDIKRLLDKGIDLLTIKRLSEKNAKNNRIYIAVNTLEYLKKGGRVSSFSATAGDILNIKPILFSCGNKFEVVKKARGLKAAEEEIKKFVLNDMEKLFHNEPIEKFKVGVAYTKCRDEAERFSYEIKEMVQTDVYIDELSSVIGCHIGEGAVATGIYKHIDESL